MYLKEFEMLVQLLVNFDITELALDKIQGQFLQAWMNFFVFFLFCLAGLGWNM